MAEISTRTVMTAVFTLHDRDRPNWPTAERVAEYLRVSTDDVLPLLRELKRKRIFMDRQRRGKRVWMSWSEAN
jgi:DNA-binding XRE family transcriptional regulator